MLFPNLRPFQLEAINRLKDPGHLVCLAGTGSGKSLIYQYLTRKSRWRTLLITPLTALARQQKERAIQFGIEAHINEIPKLLSLQARRKPELWIMSPERLMHLHSHAATSSLQGWRPDLVVIDECHCLFEWGETFRPHYGKILDWIETTQPSRSLWLSATLAPQDREKLVKKLPKPSHFMGGFALPEKLHLDVLRCQRVLRPSVARDWIQDRPGKGLVFCLTRDSAANLTDLLNTSQLRRTYYHAGLAREERMEIERRFLEEGIDVLFTTSAFAMGLDFDFVSWVLLYEAPWSITSLAQYLGRTARNGGVGHAAVLWSDEDFQRMSWMNRTERGKRHLGELYELLHTSESKAQALESYFNGPSLAKQRHDTIDVCS